MASRAQLKIRHSYATTYPEVFQENYTGANSNPKKKGWHNGVITGALPDSASGTCRIGSMLYFVGAFGGQAFMAASPVDQSLAAIDFVAPTFNSGAVINGIMAVGEELIVFGDFDTVAGETRNNICKLDRFGALQDWNPNADDVVRCAFYSEELAGLVIGGDFLNVGGAAGQFIALLDMTTGADAFAWARPNGVVHAIAADDTRNRLYIGGAFTQIGATAQAALAQYSYDSGYLPWATANGTVYALALGADGVVYVGGAFTSISGTARNYIAAIGTTSVMAAFDPGADAEVRALAIYFDTLFVGGKFTTFGAVAREKLAAIRVDATMDLWDPGVTGGDVYSLFIFERTIFASGDFNGSGSPVLNMPASAVIYYPLFADANSIFVSQSEGDDTNAGTFAAPVKTIPAAQALATSMMNVVVKDSETYRGPFTLSTANVGLHAYYTASPTLSAFPGAITGTYGARTAGRIEFYAGAGDVRYVSKRGNNATAAANDPTLPYLTVAAAVNASVDGDCVEIQDSEIYFENALAVDVNLAIQATNGQTPVICNLSSNHTIEVTSTSTLDLYGLTFAGPSFQTTSDIVRVTSGGVRNVFDCSFQGGASAIRVNSTNDSVFDIENNSFVKGWGSIADVLLAQANSIADQCIFKNNYMATYGTTVTVAQPGVSIVAGTDSNILITGNTIDRTTLRGGASVSLSSFGIEVANASAGVTCQIAHNMIRNCDSGIRYLESGSTPGGALIMYNRVESCKSGIAILVAAVPATPSVYTMQNNLCLNNGAGLSAIDTTSTAGDFTGVCPEGVTISMLENYSINSGNCAFRFLVNQVAAPGTHTLVFKGNVAFRPTLDGLKVDKYASTAADTYAGIPQGNVFYGCQRSALDSDNVLNADGSVNAQGNYFNFNTANTGATCLFLGPILTNNNSTEGLREVLFLSNVAGAENLGLFPDSPGVLTPFLSTAPIVYDVGMNNAVVTVDQSWIQVDGFNIVGDENLWAGAQVMEDRTMASFVWCTFQGCARYGLRALGSSTGNAAPLAFCSDFTENGNGAAMFQAGQRLLRSTFRGNVGAGVYDYSGANKTQHVSAYSNGIGIKVSIFSVPSNVLDCVSAANGQADLAGTVEASYSDIETLEGAEVDAQSTRLSPLFLNPDAGDLRLQTPWLDAYFESPAIGAASGGGDIGAFSFFYGAAEVVYTEIDFSLPGYRNPDALGRGQEPVKLTEGLMEDGRTYSSATAYRRVYDFTWAPEANDMPAAQVEDLLELFESNDGVCEIDFGEGFEQCVILREEMAQWTEMTGGYSSDEVPTPIATLRFRSMVQ